jgi:hypothetical protein
MSAQDSEPTLFLGSVAIPFAKYAIRRRFMGEWQITSTSEWDEDYLKKVGSACLKISSSGYGTMRFGDFEGGIDAMTDELRPNDVMQFSFHGTLEGDEVCGRGFAVEAGGILKGRVCFHRGISSEFVAERVAKPVATPKRTAKQRKIK